jgi:hypothetical protein
MARTRTTANYMTVSHVNCNEVIRCLSRKIWHVITVTSVLSVNGAASVYRCNGRTRWLCNVVSCSYAGITLNSGFYKADLFSLYYRWTM